MLRRKRFWLGLAISIGFLAVFLLRTDVSEIREAFASADYVLAIASLPLYFLGFWLRTMRWRFLLRPVNDVPTRRLYPVVLIGLMANNIAPARVGELVRAYVVGERESMSKSTALGTIAVDRAFDGLTLVALLGIIVAFSGNTAGVKLIGVLTALLFAAATVALILLALSATARAWLGDRLGKLPARLQPKMADLLDSFLAGLAAIRSPGVLAKAGVASCASWLSEASMYYVVGRAFDLDVGFHVFLLIVAAANLALALLASPGGVGPFEFATKQVLLSFGVADAAATAYALALHVLLLGPVIVIGIVILWSTQFSLSEIFGIRKPAPDEALPAPPLE